MSSRRRPAGLSRWPAGLSRRAPVVAVRLLPAALAVLLVAIGLGACGVSASSGAKKIGDAYVPNSVPNVARAPVSPNAIDPTQFVYDYLDAAAGGGEPAARTIASFLTPAALKAWQRPTSANIKIVKVLNVTKHAPTLESTVVDLTYTEVGTLNPEVDGRVVPPSAYGVPETVTFTLVHPAGSIQWRIDSRPPDGLVLSDQALTDGTYYLAQPIYFWDVSNRVLVPDLRYVPLTVSPDLRATKIIGWLIHGPSPVLADAVNALPANSSLVGLQPRDQTLVIKLSPQTGGKGTPEDLDRLAFQLQASLLLATEHSLEIWVGNSPVQPNDPTDYHTYELASRLPVPYQKYDIDNGVVKPPANEDADSSPALPALFGVKENSQVLYAAVNRRNDLAAYVRSGGSGPSLVIVSAGKAVAVKGLPPTTAAGRPAWIPDENALLIAWNGQLFSVDQAGTAKLVPTPGLANITEVTISPDGRRVALVADGQVVISAITVSSGNDPLTVRLDGQAQPMVTDPTLVATGVAWESQQQVYIVGRTAKGAYALWLVSCDSAVATDESSKLSDTAPVDIVTAPRGSFLSDSGQAVLLQHDDPRGPYRVGTRGVAPDGTKNPFFVT
jgi:hypothetical protein